MRSKGFLDGQSSTTTETHRTSWQTFTRNTETGLHPKYPFYEILTLSYPKSLKVTHVITKQKSKSFPRVTNSRSQNLLETSLKLFNKQGDWKPQIIFSVNETRQVHVNKLFISRNSKHHRKKLNSKGPT